MTNKRILGSVVLLTAFLTPAAVFSGPIGNSGQYDAQQASLSYGKSDGGTTQVNRDPRVVQGGYDPYVDGGR